MTLEEKEKYLKDQYKILYKSINWWEAELDNIFDFFKNYGNFNTPALKRIKIVNRKHYEGLLSRGSFEMFTVDKIEKEIRILQHEKKKKKE